MSDDVKFEKVAQEQIQADPREVFRGAVRASLERSSPLLGARKAEDEDTTIYPTIPEA